MSTAVPYRWQMKPSSLKLQQNNNTMIVQISNHTVFENVTKICQFERARVTFVTHATADISMNGFVPANKRYISLYRGIVHICVFKGHSTILNTANQPKIMPINKCSIGEVAKSMYHQIAQHGLF